MTGTLSLRQLILDAWLIDTLRKAPHPGLTLEELQQQWTSNPHHEGVLGRTTMTRHREMIEAVFGVQIKSPDKKHYRIVNPEQLDVTNLANDLLASVQEYMFLDEFRDLGAAIQPQQITAGREYLHPIGNALREHRKLAVTYQKFSDTEPYDCILHPYCLRASLDRWYLLAVKEGSEHPVQTFALDRIHCLSLLKDKFKPDRKINAETYFHDVFGIWVDFEHFPVQDFHIACKPHVASYLHTLPLHHSQRELTGEEAENVIKKFTEAHEDKATALEMPPEGGWKVFVFHISPSPDFLGELSRWGDGIIILGGEDTE